MDSVDFNNAVETLNATIADLNEVYANGQTREVLALTEGPTNELHLLRGWCHYRNKDFDQAYAELSKVTEETQGWIGLQAYLLSYSPEHRNEQALQELLPRIAAENINGFNAVVIAAFQKDSALDKREILANTQRFADEYDPISATVPATNLMHNMAKLALKVDELVLAENLINQAIEGYGTETNWHHRGAANFWKSMILEKAGRMDDAWSAGKDSLAAWQGQFDAEPDNPQWQERLDGAKAREQDLLAKLS